MKMPPVLKRELNPDWVNAPFEDVAFNQLGFMWGGTRYASVEDKRAGKPIPKRKITYVDGSVRYK